jgi:hypothetical protein
LLSEYKEGNEWNILGDEKESLNSSGGPKYE